MFRHWSKAKYSPTIGYPHQIEGKNVKSKIEVNVPTMTGSGCSPNVVMDLDSESMRAKESEICCLSDDTGVMGIPVDYKTFIFPTTLVELPLWAQNIQCGGDETIRCRDYLLCVAQSCVTVIHSPHLPRTAGTSRGICLLYLPIPQMASPEPPMFDRLEHAFAFIHSVIRQTCQRAIHCPSNSYQHVTISRYSVLFP